MTAKEGSWHALALGTRHRPHSECRTDLWIPHRSLVLAVPATKIVNEGTPHLDWVRDVRREGVDLQQRLDLGDFSVVGSQKESSKDSLIRAGGGHRKHLKSAPFRRYSRHANQRQLFFPPDSASSVPYRSSLLECGMLKGTLPLLGDCYSEGSPAGAAARACVTSIRRV